MTPFERPATTRAQSDSHSVASEGRGAHAANPQQPAIEPASVAMSPHKKPPPSQDSLMSVFGYMCDGPGPGPRPGTAQPEQAGDSRRGDDL
jgi:hypothetical protein